jgi:hypothetical protein
MGDLKGPNIRFSVFAFPPKSKANLGISLLPMNLLGIAGLRFLKAAARH